ncbi:SH3 domain-containing protein [Ectothiorhodospiraceae bacterium WFHF3C12]|nr:SH3 domain-containing protein [Ectothiorhodospiraceae bacterium WFHF3C12]
MGLHPPHRRAFGLIIGLLLLAFGAAAAETSDRVKVDTAFIELHTGPGAGYPIFHVVDRGDWVRIIERRTDWFRVETTDGKEGWVSKAQMEQTVQPNGEPTRFDDPSLEDFTGRNWEMGALYGVLDDVDLISLYGGYALMEKLTAELWVQQALGKFSSSYLVDFSLVHQAFPEWRVSPFVAIGGGIIHTETSATLVESSDSTDETLHAGIGVRGYLTRRFMLRAEYKEYVVLTTREENEEIEKWQLGVAFFF